jgi:hypothetical protein
MRLFACNSGKIGLSSVMDRDDNEACHHSIFLDTFQWGMTG